MTVPGRKRPHLFYRDKDGVYQSIAILRVPEAEFWRILEKELGIRFHLFDSAEKPKKED